MIDRPVRRGWRPVILAAVGAFIAQAAPATPRSETAALWESAAGASGPERIIGLYAADAWLKLPCTPVRTGATAVREAWRDFFAYSPATVSIDPESFDLSRGRDDAVERGRAHLSQNVGGLPYGTNVEYLRVWRRTAQGWRIAADIFTPGGPCERERQEEPTPDTEGQP